MLNRRRENVYHCCQMKSYSMPKVIQRVLFFFNIGLTTTERAAWSVTAQQRYRLLCGEPSRFKIKTPRTLLLISVMYVRKRKTTHFDISYGFKFTLICLLHIFCPVSFKSSLHLCTSLPYHFSFASVSSLTHLANTSKPRYFLIFYIGCLTYRTVISIFPFKTESLAFSWFLFILADLAESLLIRRFKASCLTLYRRSADPFI